MKIVKTLLLSIFLTLKFITGQCQSIEYNEFKTFLNENNATNPCITQQQYQELDKECAENIKRLGLNKINNKTNFTTSLIWPIQAAAGLTDCGYHFIGAYVDQNTLAGSINDFACGTNTYDAHQGTDIAIWPYGFLKMDNNLVEVIAAAPGTIIQKADGNFDRNCASNTITANSIIIQHADGTYALYWHMKKNSLTSKIVGQTVVAGEYLGIVGSSGSSSGPHLHFEIRSGNTSATYKDPFSGSCNLLNANSWWVNQKPHTDSKVIKVSVNTTDLLIPGCPTTETPNESDNYSIPFQGVGLALGYAKFYFFIRDDTTGMVADCKILNPNGTTFNSWTYTSTSYNKINIKGYSKLLPTTPGAYTFQVIYNGVTCSKIFNITTATTIVEQFNDHQFILSPNPSNGRFKIKFRNSNYKNLTLSIYNFLGEKLFKKDLHDDVSEIIFKEKSGVYLYKLEENNKQLFIGKLIIN